MERLPAVSLCRFGFEVVPDADGVRQRPARNEGEGLEDALAHFIVLTTAVLHRDSRAAAPCRGPAGWRSETP